MENYACGAPKYGWDLKWDSTDVAAFKAISFKILDGCKNMLWGTSKKKNHLGSKGYRKSMGVTEKI